MLFGNPCCECCLVLTTGFVSAVWSPFDAQTALISCECGLALTTGCACECGLALATAVAGCLRRFLAVDDLGGFGLAVRQRLLGAVPSLSGSQVRA